MVSILLACYNSEKYIEEQIHSIVNQTFTDWKLYISDDLSKDNTENIIKKYEENYPDKIFFKKRTVNSGVPSQHFFEMLLNCDDEYIMFCDHDDVWLPDKIEITLKRMKETEKSLPADTPVLVHTDLKVVDENLNTISESMFKMQKLPKKWDKLNNLLVQNNVTGCTMMINRALKNKITVIPEHAIMHDWWIAITAAAFGNILFIDKATVLYRQHSNNQIGAVTIKKLVNEYIFNYKQNKDSIKKTYKQARDFYNINKHLLNFETKITISNYLKIEDTKKIFRVNYIFYYNFLKYSFIRKIGQIIIV